jgi:hypothetical protein
MAFICVWIITLFLILFDLPINNAFDFILSFLTLLFGLACFLLGTFTAIFSALRWKSFYTTQHATLAMQALGSCGIGVIGAVIGLNQVLNIDLFDVTMQTIWREFKIITQHCM